MNQKSISVKCYFIIILLCSLFMTTMSACQDTTLKDEISGYTWIGDDGSKLVLSENQQMVWYESQESHHDNYYTGTYVVYRGPDAVEYLTTELSDYGITKEQLDTLFKKSLRYQQKNLYCLVFNQEHKTVGEHTTQSPAVHPYYGFYDGKNNYLDIVNLDSREYHGYTKTLEE